jgi:hypothetical protein
MSPTPIATLQGVAAAMPVDGQLEEDTVTRSYHHARNKTGIVGSRGKLWSDDVAVNALWTQLSTPDGNDVADLQQSFVRHVLTTLARTYFNIDNFASYQAAAHT